MPHVPVNNILCWSTAVGEAYHFFCVKYYLQLFSVSIGNRPSHRVHPNLTCYTTAASYTISITLWSNTRSNVKNSRSHFSVYNFIFICSCLEKVSINCNITPCYTWFTSCPLIVMTVVLNFAVRWHISGGQITSPLKISPTNYRKNSHNCR
jgi:hypothetical protein